MLQGRAHSESGRRPAQGTPLVWVSTTAGSARRVGSGAAAKSKEATPLATESAQSPSSKVGATTTHERKRGKLLIRAQFADGKIVLHRSSPGRRPFKSHLSRKQG